MVLGRLLPDLFPKIFGPDEKRPLDIEAAITEFQKLTITINDDKHYNKSMSLEDVALGFIDVANESMARPIRNMTQARGYDTKKHLLSCFGGAGGQHACSIAKSLGIKKVFIHKYVVCLLSLHSHYFFIVFIRFNVKVF